MENKQITVQEKNITDKVLTRVKELETAGDIAFPKNYSYGTALKSAFLILQETVDRDKNPVLKSCSQASIMNSLLDMTIQGLSPAKKQCYFVPFGGKLTLMRSYMGTVAATKRLKGVKDVKAFAIYEGDKFDMEFNEDTYNIDFKYEPKFDNIDSKKIKGAFAIVVGENGEKLHTEIMTIEQIKKAWGMSRTYSKDSKVHNNFTEEMVKKTVINRACKKFVNTSDDSDVLVQAINNTTANDYNEHDIIESTHAEVKEEIREEANKEFIDIDEVEEIPVVEVEEVTPVEEGAEDERGF